LITQDAYRVAGDPNTFPEQIREGLRPWQPLKLYMGGVRENEDWTLRVDPAVYSPWLGDSYANFARMGLSFQRSQNSGRSDRVAGPAYAYYKRLASRVAAPDKETSVFDGIDTRITALFATLKRPAPAGMPEALDAIQREVDAALRAFTMENPSAVVPALARGLTAVRAARRQLGSDSDADHMLGLKELQFEDAINTALAIDFTAIAQPAAAVPGESFDVKLQWTNRSRINTETLSFAVNGSTVAPDVARAATFRLTVPADMPFTRPYFHRVALSETRYTVEASSRPHPWSAAPFVAAAAYSVEGVRVAIRVPITRQDPQLPYGFVTRELAVLPAIAVNVSPRQAIVPLSMRDTSVLVRVDLVNNAAAGSTGQLRLELPAGWTSMPTSLPFSFARPGEKATYRFIVRPGVIDGRDYHIEAIATANGKEFKTGYEVIEHRDLETRYLFHDAIVGVRGVDVRIAPGLKVGYVMGVGDEVPAGIMQLGAQVRPLEAQDLASGDLSQYDAIMTGTRAYAVRDDLRTYNRRLFDYVQNGGNLIVLYNTPAEFDPNVFAPYPAQLPRDAEEVSEEDSPVTILAPARRELTTPNAIGQADFDGWVEQRGSKFFSQWDRTYTPMIETHDQGQAPQRGGWVTATYGKGHYTYFAYAFHRQLPYGVPGAYRLLANLLSLGKP
jgi:hypothetical protein